MSRETELDMNRTGPVSREDRKAAILADLREVHWDKIVEIKSKALQAIAHNEACYGRQNANAETLRKNNARHHLVVECCDERLSELRAMDANTN